MRKNAIQHVKSPPSSNGLAERAVQMLKEGLKKLEGSLETSLSRFLFNYRITPHTSTGTSPVKVVFGHQLQSSLDKVRPSRERISHREQIRLSSSMTNMLNYYHNYFTRQKPRENRTSTRGKHKA